MSVDLSGPLYQLYRNANESANNALQNGKPEAASRFYLEAARWMEKYSEYSQDLTIKKRRQKIAEKLEKISLQLKQKKNSIREIPNDDSQEPKAGDSLEEEILALKTSTKTDWKDIGGLEDIKGEIKTAFLFGLAKYPKGIAATRQKNILLYGPSGTGKTLLASAIAGSMGANFFNAKLGGLLSKYFGESTKLISSLYKIARKESPSVIFLDEFESISAKRDTGESGAERRVIATLLTELDGLESKQSNNLVLTVAATNLPWLIDPAFISRFQSKVYIGLPDKEARTEIFEIHIDRRGHICDLSLEELSSMTDGFSGREIEQLCNFAVTNMLTRTNKEIIGSTNLKEISNYELKISPLSEEDFAYAFSRVHPIIAKKDLEKFTNWGDNATFT